MPIYEYKCLNCGLVVEVHCASRSKGFEQLDACPECSCHSWGAVFSPPYLKFRGGGWNTPKKAGDDF